MFFALCRIELFIPQGRSLKGKRSVVSGLKERLRVRFHASVAEVGEQDLHQRGLLGVALVGVSPTALDDALAAMRRLIELESRCAILSWQSRVEPFAADAEARGEGFESLADHWDEHAEDDEEFGPTWDRREE